MTAMAGLAYQVGLCFLYLPSNGWHAVQMTDLLFTFLVAASGDSSMEREFSGALGGPTVSTPNSKETSPSRSLSGQ